MCRKGCTNTMCRVVNALNWYAQHNREHVGANPEFSCSSPHIENALRTQKCFIQSAGGAGRPGSDPHLGLKDILPEMDKVCMMEYIIYRHHNDWGGCS
jgi:hypothetical protein